MYHIMDCSRPRRVTACNVSYLREGVTHPNRLMPDTHDIVYICQGGWDIIQGDDVYSLKPNDALLLHAGVPHSGVVPCQNDTLAMYVHFSADPSDALTSACDITSWPDAVLLGSVTHCANNSRVKAIFSELIHVYFSSAPNVNIKLSALMVMLLYELFLVSMAKIEDGSTDELVAELLSKLRLSPHLNFTLRQAADALFVSPRTLSNHVKRSTGMSFADYQRHIKLEDIKRVLVNEPTLTLADIARDNGFCDESHLSKAFKRAYDCTPSQYRRQPRPGYAIGEVKPSRGACE